MKNYKKIFGVVVLLLTALILVSCGPKENKTGQHLIYDLNPADLVVDEFTESSHINSLYIYEVQYQGQMVLKTIHGATEVKYFDASNNETTVNAIRKEYYYNLTGYDAVVIKQYLESSEFESFLYADFLDVDNTGKIEGSRNGAVLSNDYLFNGQNIDFYLVSNEEVKKIAETDEITFTGFRTGDDLLTENGKSYLTEFNDLVTADYEGSTVDFVVRLYSTIKPINYKTATFWNWIFLKMPIAYLMSFIGSIFNNSFAWAILFTTIIIRTMFWPIYAKTNDMTMKMSVMQPDLDKLQKKYAGKSDPESQQKMRLEMTQIYKKHKVNPLGCLLPFLQMPIFIGMYQVVREITIPGGQFYNNVSNTKFFLTDLLTNGVVAKIVFTILVGVTMFALQKISQVKPSYIKKGPENKDPKAQQQQQSMKMVSFIMIFMMVMTAHITPGLALSYYWIIGNIFSMGQTIFNRYLSEKKYAKMEEEKLYGRSREIIDAEFKKRGDK